MKFTNEMIEKAKVLKSVEELAAFAKENGEELGKEQAENLFAKLHKSGELADDELDNVAGGCSEGSLKPERPAVCPVCGSTLFVEIEDGWACTKCPYRKR